MTARGPARPLRVAVVNWRDPWHPAAGGAERYAWEVARRLAAAGMDVRYVTARAPGQRRRQEAEGVPIVRLGGRFTVYPLVLLWMLAHRRRFDAVLDCQNGIPFFTPWVLPRRVPVFCVVHHVHTEQFGMYFPPWLARLGRLLEGPVARRTYRRHACVAVSPSTRHAMRERLRWDGPIHLVPNGLTMPPEGPPEPARGLGDPALVCVSRLVPHKRLERLVDLALHLRERHPGLRVHIIGDGPQGAALAERVAAAGLTETVILHGFVSERRKAALVAGADLHLSTSRGEGWGLSVIEAASLGVPTVAYDVEGLRDAVRDGVTGWLACDDDLPGAVERALKELADPVRRAEIAASCRRWAAVFDWSRTAAHMAALLKSAVHGEPAARPDLPEGWS
ncbi:glycosyltransferase family 4 protein [Thermomonospora curvata]|uniref:Glycosyl transferase group 1 n=1 Tax=Thermomonospora curvata (strain ATCC 19995 / DSM 43183 / JCM 3096 / KCTC 9072 / NBRC 15933 / NCIMB 10081 / Henssen B9) TaxID=471852 RepID=D1AE96_THECD|nr:glycosyltransferase family 4 protein [Thermomonospora curvata]ACY99522.1 glycosyl transferase group 1 [Thermomonospora curvata DSM 43183]